MAHLDEVIVKVDDALAEGVIAHMNELLIALSDDAQLSRGGTLYPAAAFAHRHRPSCGRQHQEEQGRAPRAADQRGRDPLEDAFQNWASGHQPGAHHQHHRPA